MRPFKIKAPSDVFRWTIKMTERTFSVPFPQIKDVRVWQRIAMLRAGPFGGLAASIKGSAL